MTQRRFPSSQLYALRNEIKVQKLIEKTLHIPCRETKGCFRFLCPLCNGFDTAVNPKTNLARCFRCEQNFNTIDLVMLVRQVDFIRSAKFLQSIHQKENVGHDNQGPKPISDGNHQGGSRLKLKTPSAKSGSRLHHIGEILDRILPHEHPAASEKTCAQSKPDQIAVAQQNSDQDRLVKLEQQLEYLSHQIEKMARTLNVAFPSK